MDSLKVSGADCVCLKALRSPADNGAGQLCPRLQHDA